MTWHAREEEWTMLDLSFQAASKFVEHILDNSDPNGTIAGTNLVFADCLCIYYHNMYSTLKAFQMVACGIGWFKSGDTAALPEIYHPCFN